MNEHDHLHGIICQSPLFAVDYGCDADDYTEGSISLLDYNTNATEAGCTIYEMVNSAESAGVMVLLMMRTEDDPYQYSPPNARLYSKSCTFIQYLLILCNVVYSRSNC